MSENTETTETTNTETTETPKRNSADRFAEITTAVATLPTDKAPSATAVKAFTAAIDAAMADADEKVCRAVRSKVMQAKRSWPESAWPIVRSALERADEAAADRVLANRGGATRHVDPVERPAASLAAARAIVDALHALPDTDLLTVIGFTAEPDGPTPDAVVAAATALGTPSPDLVALRRVTDALRIRGGSGSGTKTVHGRSWSAIAPVTLVTASGAKVSIAADGTATAKVDGKTVTGSPNKVAGALAGTASGSVNAWVALRNADGVTAAKLHDEK